MKTALQHRGFQRDRRHRAMLPARLSATARTSTRARGICGRQVTNNGNREKLLTTEKSIAQWVPGRHEGDGGEPLVIRIPVARALQMPESFLSIPISMVSGWERNPSSRSHHMTCDVGAS